ncbi:glycosyl hydrolase, partial [Streptomyces sp. NPDC057429]
MLLRHKLVVGMPFHGQRRTGVTGGGGGGGPGQLAGSGRFTARRDPGNGRARLFGGATPWTYDDPRALGARTSYIRTEATHHGRGAAAVGS